MPRDAPSRSHLVCVALVSVCCGSLALPASAVAAVSSGRVQASEHIGTGEHGAASLEAAATRASATGRTVAMSLIGLAFAIAATVLAFRRDFKEAAGVFAVGIVAILLATPAGMNLLRDTVSSLFGA
jgi:hypothetical protein